MLLTITMSIVNCSLSLGGQQDLKIFFIWDSIVFLVITILQVYLNPRSRTALGRIGVLLFSGYLAIILFRIIDIVSLR